jgi:uncharacterized membrane protein YbhN (UPF0104 family)
MAQIGDTRGIRLPRDDRHLAPGLRGFPSARRIATLLAKVATSTALLWLALRTVDTAALVARSSRIEVGWVFLGFVVGVLQKGLAALRWREVARGAGISLRPADAFRYTMIGAFFNQALPSSLGGDAVRLWLIRDRAGLRAAAYTALVDRGIGLLVLAALIVIGLPFSLPLVHDATAQLILTTLGVASLAVSVGFVLFGLVDWPWLRRFAPARHLHGCAQLAARIIFNWRSFLSTTTLSTVNHILAAVLVYAAVQAIAAPATFGEILALALPVLLVCMLPLSIAGWGLREASMAAAFVSAGLSQGDGLIVSLIFGLTQLAVGALGGLTWIETREERTGARAKSN